MQPITPNIKKLRSTIPKITGKIKSQDDLVKLFIFAPKIIERGGAVECLPGSSLTMMCKLLAIIIGYHASVALDRRTHELFAKGQKERLVRCTYFASLASLVKQIFLSLELS